MVTFNTLYILTVYQDNSPICTFKFIKRSKAKKAFYALMDEPTFKFMLWEHTERKEGDNIQVKNIVLLDSVKHPNKPVYVAPYSVWFLFIILENLWISSQMYRFDTFAVRMCVGACGIFSIAVCWAIDTFRTKN